MKFKKTKIISVIFCFILFSCIKKEQINSELTINEGLNNKVEEKINDYNENIVYYDYGISPIEIIFPQNQTIAQGLSVVVTDNNGNLIVIDGGRTEDADYLCDIIKKKGKVVKYWYLTHIHDDHIGALLKIMTDKRTDIEIKNLVYNFANFDWYYSKMGTDAGIYYLFENTLEEYNKYLSDNFNRHVAPIKYVVDEKDKHYKFYTDDKNTKEAISFEVDILNYMYKLDQDPINNTSLVYLITMSNNKKMLVFGDLGYEGGYKLFDEMDNDAVYGDKFYDSDIIVLSHHGQNGIPTELYKKFNPEIIIWPTSKDIYENVNKKYYTDDTKEALSSIDTIKYEIKTYEETAIIR